MESELAALKARVAALEETRLTRFRRTLQRNKRLLAAVVVAALLTPIAIYAAAGVIPFSFTAGNTAVASEVNANFTYLNSVSVPIGGIIGWHQDLTGVPALPGSGEWVKCDGQTLSDANSPMNGQVIPNLNGNSLGANSPGHTAKVQMFLRGGTVSGSGQQDAFQGHWHWIHSGYRNVAAFTQALVPGNGSGGTSWPGGWPTLSGGSGANTDASTGGDVANQNPGKFFATTEVSNATSGASATTPGSTGGADRNHGTPRTASETRPSNMSVVWIMRVK